MLEEMKIVPANSLGDGWNWVKYDDGSGHLESPSGEKFMGYDLCTNEYDIKYDNHYDFFPLSYYYVDGFDPKDFKPFEFMENEMKEYLYLKNKGDDAYGI